MRSGLSRIDGVRAALLPIMGRACAREALGDLLPRFSVEPDAVEQALRYTPRIYEGAERATHVAAYIVVRRRRVRVHARFQYAGPDWISWNALAVRIGNKKYPLVRFEEFQAQHDKSASRAREWVDVPMDGQIRRLVKRMTRGKEVVVRFVGERRRYAELRLSPETKAAIRDVFLLERLLKAGARLPSAD